MINQDKQASGIDILDSIQNLCFLAILDTESPVTSSWGKLKLAANSIIDTRHD